MIKSAKLITIYKLKFPPGTKYDDDDDFEYLFMFELVLTMSVSVIKLEFIIRFLIVEVAETILSLLRIDRAIIAGIIQNKIAIP